MKKLISIVLVAVMLLSVLPLATFAKEDYAGAAATTAPEIDGKVNENEYSWTSGQYDRDATVENEFHIVAATGANVPLYAQWWMSYDADYVYVAYKERGDYKTEAWIDLNPALPAASQLSLYFIFNRGDCGGAAMDAEGTIKSTYVFEYSGEPGNSSRVEANVADYVIDSAGSWHDDGAKNWNTVEFKLSREALANYAGVENFDQIGIRGFIQSQGEQFYANNNSEYKALGTHSHRGYHIVNLGEETESETDAPAHTANVEVNGVIEDEEYAFTSGELARTQDGGLYSHWIAAATANSKSTYFWDYDADYIYFAYRGEGDMVSDMWLYLNADIESKEAVRLYLRSDWGTAQNPAAVLLTADDVSSALTWGDYVEEYASDNWDTGSLNVNEIELKIKRAALSDEAYDLLALRALNMHENGNAGEFFFGEDPATSVVPYKDFWFYSYAGYKIISLGGEIPEPDVDTESESETESETTPAPTPTSYYDLAAYGQKTIKLETAKTPTMDAAIADGEYEFTHNAVVANDATDDFFFIRNSDKFTGATYAKFYVAADAENVYFASVTDDTDVVDWLEGLFLSVSAENTSTYVRFFASDRGAAELLGKDPNGKVHGVTQDEYIKGSAHGTANGETFFEVTLSRAALEKAFGTELDKLLFAASQTVVAADEATVVLGFDSDALSLAKYPSGYKKCYPFVLDLTSIWNDGETETETEPGIDVPAVTPVDGLIGDNEYAWTSGSYDRNTTIANEFYVITPHQDNVAHHAQWWLNYDNNFIYLAYKERSGYNTTARIDLAPNGDGKVSLEFSFDRVNANGENTGYAIQSVKVITYAADGTPTEANVTDFVVSNAGSYFDDGQRNVNSVEFIINRAALEKYAGASFNTIGLRGYSFSAQSDPNDGWASKPAASMYATANEGYHTINLFAPHTCTTTKWDADKSDAFGHYGKCDVCGEPVEAAHTYGRERVVVEATCVQPGRVTKTCVDCEYIFTKATEADPTAHKFANGKCAVCGAAETVETEPVETEPTETEPTETKPVETKPVETKPVETKPVETTPVETEPADEKGCGGSIAAVAVALVAALGTCVVFAGKKRD